MRLARQSHKHLIFLFDLVAEKSRWTNLATVGSRIINAWKSPRNKLTIILFDEDLSTAVIRKSDSRHAAGRIANPIPAPKIGSRQVLFVKARQHASNTNEGHRGKCPILDAAFRFRVTDRDNSRGSQKPP